MYGQKVKFLDHFCFLPFTPFTPDHLYFRIFCELSNQVSIEEHLFVYGDFEKKIISESEFKKKISGIITWNAVYV